MNKNKKTNLPMILVILDGWGAAPPGKGNAVTIARTPVFDGLLKKYPSTMLYAHGAYVGLPAGQVGNSEAGHMNIGAGRVVEQDSVKIEKTIADGTFYRNPAFLEAIAHAKKHKSAVHLMGMISNEMSPHSDPKHLAGLLELVRRNAVKDVYLHLFTDGRDSPRYASLELVKELEKKLKANEKIATIMGRYYAMERTKRWNITEKAYNALVAATGRQADCPEAAIVESHNRGETDEFIEPCAIRDGKKILPRIKDGDSIIFFNLRSDRARQLAKAFVQKEFNKKNFGSFKRKKFLKSLRFISMTDFGPDLDFILTAFPAVILKNTLPVVLKNLRQLYLAEGEKYAHVTYFLNGGYANPVDGEIRQVIPSPDVKSYDRTPLMRSAELKDSVLKNLKAGKYDFTFLNFAAPDMIGHTGNLQAGIQCCEGVDRLLGEIVAAYAKAGGTALITADHGNIEEMENAKTGEVDTEHSVNLVNFILVNDDFKKIKLRNKGSLSDVAPTILDILKIDKPAEMTGKSLIKKYEKTK